MRTWDVIRFVLLLLVACAVLVVQAGHIYYTVNPISPLSWDVNGLSVSFDNGYMVVDAVAERSIFDRRGPHGKPLLRPGDFVAGVKDSSGREYFVRDLFEWSDILRKIPYGKRFTLILHRANPDLTTEEFRFLVPPLTAPVAVFWTQLGKHWQMFLFSLFCIFTGIFIGTMKPEAVEAFYASLLLFCLAVLPWEGGHWRFPTFFREVGLLVWILLFSILTATYLRFFLRYPSPSSLDRKFPWLKHAGIGFGLVFAGWNLFWHFSYGTNWRAFLAIVHRFIWIDVILDVIFTGLFAVGVCSLVLNLLNSGSLDDRRRLLLLFMGSLGVLPYLCIFLVRVTIGGGFIPDGVRTFALLLMLALPFSFAYAVLKHRIFGIRVILRRGLHFALLSKAVLFLEGLLIFVALYYAALPLLERIMYDAGQGLLAMVTAAVTLGTVLGIRRLNHRLMPLIERRFFREAYDARHILAELSLKVRRLGADPDELISTVTQTIVDALHPAGAAVFLRGSEILRMPVDSERQREIRRSVTERHARDFYCLCYKANPQEEPLFKESSTEIIRLPADSILVRKLEAVVDQELDTLDLDLRNPRSWARTVLESGSINEKKVIREVKIRLLVPLVTNNELLGFMALGQKLSEEPYSFEDDELLLAVAQQAADTLDHAGLVRERHEQVQLQREIEIAKQVQENLLTHLSVPVTNLDYAAVCKPARYVGGDYFDFILRGNDRIGIALGDISGKGVSAALLMATLQASLRIHADFHGTEVDRIMGAINNHMHDATDASRFATLFFGFFESAGRTLTYANAGQNPPFILRFNEGKQEVHTLPATGVAVGIFPDAGYGRRTIQLHPGDVLLAYSDGVTEAMNSAQEFFEEERLVETVSRHSGERAEEILEGILADLDRFIGEAPQHDDITLIVAKVL